MNVCPFPNCSHVFDILTKHHCESHGMSREKLIKKYGQPKPCRVDNNALKKNMKNFKGITPAQFIR